MGYPHDLRILGVSSSAFLMVKSHGLMASRPKALSHGPTVMKPPLFIHGPPGDSHHRSGGKVGAGDFKVWGFSPKLGIFTKVGGLKRPKALKLGEFT